MKRILVAASAVAFLACAGAAFAQDAKVERGKQLFADNKCSLCHSIAGKGNPKGPLDDVGSKLTAAEMKQWLNDAKTMAAKEKKDRKPPMKDFSKMPTADKDALVAYLQTLKK